MDRFKDPKSPVDIDLPLFSAAQVAHVAGIRRGLVDLWVHRGVIEPSHLDETTRRARASFSLAVAFEARLMRVLNEHVGVGSTDASEILKSVMDDRNWLYHVARHSARGDTLELFAIVTKIDGCWQTVRCVGADKIKLEFGKEVPEIVVFLGAIFKSVYDDCLAMLSPHGNRPRKRRRARS